jgi:hypothetical protein
MNRAAVVASLFMAGVASAATVTNTFDSPVGPVVADGMTALGVTFHFSEGGSPSGFATYGSAVGMPVLPLTDPVLDGPTTGVLTLEFLSPVTALSFDFLLGMVDAELAEGVSVVLSGPDYIGSAPFTAPTGIPIGEPVPMLGIGSFSFVGSPFLSAAITFSSAAQMFAIDNLVYNQIDLQALPIHAPEPGTLALTGTAILLAALRVKRGRRGQVR